MKETEMRKRERRWIVVHEFIPLGEGFLRRTRPQGRIQLSDRSYEVQRDGSLRRTT